MSAMHERELERSRRARAVQARLARLVAGAGFVATVIGFSFGAGREGHVPDRFTLLAGAGLVTFAIGTVTIWLSRAGDPTPPGSTKREQLQALRSRQLLVFPVMALFFLGLALKPTMEIVAGEGEFDAYAKMALPVLYAWVTAAMVMGWDTQSRTHRRYLEDELTASMRTRAVAAAFIVLMAGATVALVIGLIRSDFGAFALLSALAATGATAGMRFAWLDREAGRSDEL